MKGNPAGSFSELPPALQRPWPRCSPILTIKEAKVYVADLSSFRRLNSSETGEILSVVTNSGHEGNYTIGNRGLTANWLEWAKPALLGKNVIDLLPTITATTGTQETFGFSGGRSGGPGGGRVERMLLPAAGGGVGRGGRPQASGEEYLTRCSS